MWPEVALAQEGNRFELVLCGPKISARIEKAEGHLDPSIFDMKNLNYLDITKTTLKYLPETIGELTNLQSLVLNSNQIETITPQVGNLKKLKLLDVSSNKIDGQITERLDEIPTLTTLNLAQNRIDTFPKLIRTVNITTIDLTSNRLSEFPDVCRKELSNLSVLKLAHNQITSIPPEVKHLINLKTIEIVDNQIKVVPGELGECSKLKTADLRENPISDRRFLKLIQSNRMKQIIDYMRAHCPKVGTKEPEQPTKQIQPQIEYKYRIKIHRMPENEQLKILVDESVKEVREHFVACLIDSVNFTMETFKKFIQLQNKLHDDVCQRRNVSTIATHDYNKLPAGDLVYTTLPPEELEIHPINRPGPVKGTELYNQLETEANNLRQEKKRINDHSSGLHKYLYLIENWARYPCLIDSSKRVVSFPPITNSEGSKIDLNTKRILVEVTSSVSLATAKHALEMLLKDMTHILDGDVDVTQVKTVDREAGGLKVLFPSKTDFKFEEDATDVTVERD